MLEMTFELDGPVFMIDRSSMIHNVRPWVRPSVRRPEPYNLPNRNRYEKNVITKKLGIDKIRCNKNYFFKTLFFSAYGKLLVEKNIT